MSEEFVTWQRFNNVEDMLPMAEFLQANGIVCQLNDLSANFDVSYANNEFQKDLRIKLRQEDFEKADRLMQDKFSEDLDKLPADYYLFSFTNKELVDIVSKKDEWGIIDFLLAKKLLKERGVQVTDEQLKGLEKDRISELSLPQSASTGYLLAAYFGVITFGLMSGVMGSMLLSKKALPDGTKVHIYDKSSRDHGVTLCWVSVLISLTALIKIFLIPFRF